MKIGAMYRVNCPTNMRLNGKVGILVAAHLDRMQLIPYILMLDGKMLSFDKDELVLLSDPPQ
jgi:hypothetical protein